MNFQSVRGQLRKMPIAPIFEYIDMPIAARGIWLEMWARCEEDGVLHIGTDGTLEMLGRWMYAHRGDKRLLKKYLPLLEKHGLISIRPPLLFVTGFLEANPPPKVRAEEGFVYVVRPRGSDVIKVGKAIDVQKRLATLQTAHPDILDLLIVLPGGREQEAFLHRMLEDCRIRGEWFRADAEILDFIADLKKPVEEF